MGFEIQNHVLIRYIDEPGVTEVTVPDGVTEIGKLAFSRSIRIRKIILPDSVTKIGDAACCCDTLEEIDIPDSVTEIGEESFYGTALKEVILPKFLKHLPERLFHECWKLEKVTLPEGLETIGDEAFFLSELKKIDIPESVRMIGSFAFGGRYTVQMHFHKNQRITKIKQYSIWENNAPEKRLMAFFEHPSGETFSALKAEYKLPAAYSYFDIDEKISAYLKRNIRDAVRLAIDENQPEVLKGILERKLIIKKHIDELIQYAIDKTQNGGNPEFQVMLTDYKYQNFLADAKQIGKKLKL